MLLEEIMLKSLEQLHVSTVTYSTLSQTSVNNGKTYLKLKASKNGLVTSGLSFQKHPTAKNLSSKNAIYKKFIP